MKHFSTALTSLLTAVLWATVAMAETPLERGTEVRAFLKDVVVASQQAKSAQPQAMRKAFADHPKVLLWVAQEENFDHLIKDANLTALQSSMPGEKEIAKELQELVKAQAQQVLSKPEFQTQVAQAIGAQIAQTNVEELPLELRNDPELQAFAKDKGKGAAQYFAHLPPEKRLETLKSVPNDTFLELGGKVDHAVVTTDISKTDSIQMLTDKNAFDINADLASPEDTSNLMKRYFETIPADKRRKMAVAYLSLAPNASQGKQLAVVLDEATGPGMKKVFQLFGEDANSETLKDVAEELKENVKRVPYEEIRPVIEEELGGKIDDLFLEFNRESIASGTIGQTYAGTLKNGRKVVIKVLRPGVAEELKAEMAQLRVAIKGTPLEKVVDQIEENLIRESNFRIEAENLGLARQAYIDQKRGIYTTERITDFEKTSPSGERIVSSRVIVTERAEGKSMARLMEFTAESTKSGFTAQRVQWLSNALGEFFELWFDTAVFGSGHYGIPEGFFHGDPHEGNYFLIRQNGKGKPNYKMTLIDLGNGGTLTVEQRRAFMHMGLAAVAGSKEETIEAMSRVSQLTPEGKAAILKSLNASKWNELSASERITLALKVGAMDGGLKFPRDFLGFKRGLQFLEKTIAELNEILDKVDPAKKIKRFNIMDPLMSVAKKRAAIEIPGQLFSSKIRSHTVAPIGDTSKLVFRLAKEKVDVFFHRKRVCGPESFGNLLKPKE